MSCQSMLVTVAVGVLLCVAAVAAQVPLGSYNVNPKLVFTSGLSSGACMATQFSIAFSSTILGAGTAPWFHLISTPLPPTPTPALPLPLSSFLVILVDFMISSLRPLSSSSSSSFFFFFYFFFYYYIWNQGSLAGGPPYSAQNSASTATLCMTTPSSTNTTALIAQAQRYSSYDPRLLSHASSNSPSSSKFNNKWKIWSH